MTLDDVDDYPNGLAFADDELYLAQTALGLVSRYRWDGNRPAPAGDPLVLPEGGPDGLALDAEGRVYVAAPEANAVFVFGRNGALEETIGFSEPAFPTNLCFAGPDLDLLVVTAAKGGRVLVCERVSDAPGRKVTPEVRPAEPRSGTLPAPRSWSARSTGPDARRWSRAADTR